MSVQELERMVGIGIYEADLHHTPIGWGFTVYRDGIIVGRLTGWLCLRYRSQKSALAGANRFARHHRERYRIPLNA